MAQSFFSLARSGHSFRSKFLALARHPPTLHIHEPSAVRCGSRDGVRRRTEVTRLRVCGGSSNSFYTDIPRAINVQKSAHALEDFPHAEHTYDNA